MVLITNNIGITYKDKYLEYRDKYLEYRDKYLEYRDKNLEYKDKYIEYPIESVVKSKNIWITNLNGSG